jgi:uncharacterized protein (TIGR02391 family)
MDTLPTLYPNVVDLLATPAEDLVPLLLKFARRAIQNGIFAPDTVNADITEANNIYRQRPSYAHTHGRQVYALLNEAWAIIEAERLIVPAPGINGTNGFRMFTQRGEAISDAVDFKRLRDAATFPKSLLHPLIADQAMQALMRGDLGDAVFKSFRTVEEAVRTAGAFTAAEVGVKLMYRAFDKDKGPLTDMSQPEAERVALGNLFAGAIGSYKNPHSHRTVSLTDVREAQEQVMLASHLLRIVDARKPKRHDCRALRSLLHPIHQSTPGRPHPALAVARSGRRSDRHPRPLRQA